MSDFSFPKPNPSSLGDHDVAILGSHLRGKRIALLVTGGIAAMKAPLLARGLRRYEADVVVYASNEALRYTTIDALEWSSCNKVISTLTADAEHLSRKKPFALYLIAPATYNTINKIRHGIADSPITTTIATAIGLLESGKTQIAIAPTMHGDMHNSILDESLRFLHGKGCHLIPSRDANGKHNLPEIESIVAHSCRILSTSRLKGKNVLVTGGPTPVAIDSVRRITNKFRGHVGIEIAKEAFLRGANVKLILGSGSVLPPSYLKRNTISIDTYPEYLDTVLKVLSGQEYSFGVFSAAVADYMPSNIFKGKIPSNSGLTKIDLIPTQKVIDVVRDICPNLKLVSFKFEINIELDKLMSIGEQRIKNGHFAIVLNRAEDTAPTGMHKAHVMNHLLETITVTGKSQIANTLADLMESNS